MKVPLPALVIAPPLPLMTPANVDDRLLVLPIVKVLLPSVVLPELVNAPMVCEAPTLNVAPDATSTAASVPSAVA